MKFEDIQWSDKIRKGHEGYWPIGEWPDDKVWSGSEIQIWRDIEITAEGLALKDRKGRK